MSWKDSITEYLSFTRRDRIAIITLIILISLVFLLPELVSPATNTGSMTGDTSWMAALKRIEVKGASREQSAYDREENSTAYQYDRAPNRYSKTTKGELFKFDPNTLSKEGWKRLGLREKTISTILNYVSKGGKFRKPEDLQKIYGLFPDEFNRIAPFITISTTGETNNYKSEATTSASKKQNGRDFTPVISRVDINAADSSAFIALPGIGSKLSARIINFRDKLGGFYSIDQVGETYGLPDSTYQKIRPYLVLEHISIRKININTVKIDELKIHPYIRYTLANPIVAYRNTHGPFSSIEDLKKVMVITDEIYAKISPYLSL